VIPADAVLLIPEPEVGQPPAYGIKSGYYNHDGLLDLLEVNQGNREAVRYIADMLESGDEESDGFVQMLRSNQQNPVELARIVKICKE
jgi:hypothetical protein